MNDSHCDEARRLRDEGYAQHEAARIADAERMLLRARTLAPDDPLVHFRLALLFVDTGRPEDAVAALDEALRLQPDNARARNNRGSAPQVLQRLPEAESAFRRALALDPSLVQPYTNRGHLLELQGPAREAVELYGQARSRGLRSAAVRASDRLRRSCGHSCGSRGAACREALPPGGRVILRETRRALSRARTAAAPRRAPAASTGAGSS